MAEALVADGQRVAAGQTGQAIRQILAGWHGRALDQDRDNPNATGQCCLNLQPDDVIGIIQPAAAAPVGRDQPGRADDRQQHPAGCHRAEDLLSEIHAELDRVHIDENLVLAETISQSVMQPTRKMAGFLSAVADKDAATVSYCHVSSRYRKGIWTGTYQLACDSKRDDREAGTCRVSVETRAVHPR
jgi:hypothetical protein